MSKINQFEDLEIWKQATQVAIDVFELTKNDPLRSDFGTKDQVRRASFSISSNIAEGFEYSNDNDFSRYLKYAKGSAGELRSQFYILWRTGLISEDLYRQKHRELVSISRQIATLIGKIAEKKKGKNPSTFNL